MSNEWKFLNIYIFQLASSNQLVDSFFAPWNQENSDNIFASKSRIYFKPLKIIKTVRKVKVHR